jgi:hypothetical protein
MQKLIQPPACLDHGLHVPNPRSIPPNRTPKMQERHYLFFGLRLMSKEFQQSYNPNQNRAELCGIFHHIKVRRPIGRKDSMQTKIRTSRRLDSFLHGKAQNFEVFS